MSDTSVQNYESLAKKTRESALVLQSLSASTRRSILLKLAELLVSNSDVILEANEKDISVAQKNSTDENLLARLILSKAKLETLATGIRQISEQDDPIGKVLRTTELSDGLVLCQKSVPLGVLMVIFESRPDALPQIAALSIYSGNGLLLKGGKEAFYSNACLYDLVRQAIVLGSENTVDASVVTLVHTRDDISQLLKMDKYIDLVIPRGSGQLVKSIQDNTRIPVMGHAEGVCHVYIDSEVDIPKACRITVDAKCDYPAACNAAETVLVHQAHVSTGVVKTIIESLQAAGVDIFYGPRMIAAFPQYHDKVAHFRTEYGTKAISFELVDDVKEAIRHINNYGSHHTETILSTNAGHIKTFQTLIDSACVFANASTRFADGFRFGLGAEVGISTSRLHARGPVGIEGLTSTKWVLDAQDGEATVSQFSKKQRTYTHRKL